MSDEAHTCTLFGAEPTKTSQRLPKASQMVLRAVCCLYVSPWEFWSLMADEDEPKKRGW